MRLLKNIQWLGLVFMLLINSISSFAQRSNCSNALTQISSDSLMQHLQELVGKKTVYINNIPQVISSRYAFHAANAIAANYLAQKCASYGFTVRNFDYSGTGRNVIAEKKGSTFPFQAIMLCAHYDCVGGTYTKSQGADDNASGCAALIEAARVLKDIDFPYTIQFVFWDEEEINLLGSKAYPTAGGNLPDLLTVINLDMIAWDGNQDSLAMFHANPSLPLSEQYASRLHYIINKYKLPLVSKIKSPGESNTDHQALWDKGIPAIGLTEDYDNDFNPHWHRYSDSIENMHIPYFTAMSKLAIMGMCEFAQEGPTSIHQMEAVQEIKVYPNPTEKDIVISGLQQETLVNVYNSMGQIISTHVLQGKEDNNISLPKLPGFYVVSFFGSNQQILRFKILVK